MSEFKSFLEVRPGDDILVEVGGQRLELGCIKSIYATHPKYIVWLDEKSEIWYEIDYSKLELSDEFHGFWTNYQSVRSESLHNFTEAQKHVFHQMLASSLSSALEGQFEAAKASLESARAYTNNTNQRSAKNRYLVGVLVSTGISAAVSIILYVVYYYLSVDQVFQFCAHALCGGAVGTILSSTTGKIQDTRFDPNATPLEGYLNGALRTLYGLCGALTVIIIFKSGLIDSKFITINNDKYAYFLIAIVGGFAERYAANILTNFSRRKDDNE